MHFPVSKTIVPTDKLHAYRDKTCSEHLRTVGKPAGNSRLCTISRLSDRLRAAE